MKSILSLCVLSFISLSARADLLKGDFTYKFQTPQAIGMCDGASIHVLSVNKIGGTFSGGAHGSDVVLNQALADRFGVFGPRHDLRGTIDSILANHYDVRISFRYGPSLGQAMSPAVRLMEQIPVRNSDISVCISRFDLKHIDQTPGIGTDINWDIGFKVFLNSDTPQGRQTMLVEELGGEFFTRAQFYNVIYDWNFRCPDLIGHAWPQLNDNFANFLHRVPNQEAEKNLAGIKAELGGLIDGGAL